MANKKILFSILPVLLIDLRNLAKISSDLPGNINAAYNPFIVPTSPKVHLLILFEEPEVEFSVHYKFMKDGKGSSETKDYVTDNQGTALISIHTDDVVPLVLHIQRQTGDEVSGVIFPLLRQPNATPVETF